MDSHLRTTQLFAIFISAAMISIQTRAAEPIEFPEEELATESVLPVFDEKVAVRGRIVKTANRFEVGGGVGLNLIEALYDNFTYNMAASYHFDEESAVTMLGTFTSNELSNMGKDLKAGRGIDTYFDASKAPSPEYFFSGNYQFTAYYGKVSVTKSTAMNLSMHGMAGVGAVSFGDSVEPLLNVGVGQRLYFTPSIALRLDLHLMIFRGPDPTSKTLTNTDPVRTSDELEKTLYYRSFLAGSLVFLL